MPHSKSFVRTCLVVALGQALALSARAAIITVDSATDDDAGCTLREAIATANVDSDLAGCTRVGGLGADTINFDVSLPATITLASSLPDIISTVTINGPGQDQLILDGNGYRPFVVNSAALMLNNLTISGGSAVFGGGIISFDNSYIRLTSCTLSSNTAGDHGGGIHTQDNSTIVLVNSTLFGNSAGDAGGGLYANGSSVSLTDSTVSGSTASIGGGIFAGANSITSLTNSTLSGNYALGNGGGILASMADVSLDNSTLSGNSTKARGGGIAAFNTSISLNNCTLSGNSTSVSGGGMYIAGTTADLSNSILSGNSTDGISAEFHNGGSNSIYADHNNLVGHDGLGANAFHELGLGPNDINATIYGDSVPLVSILDATLADNGGPTLTHALVAGSPAIGAADFSSCPENDQRGRLRESGFFFLVRTVGGTPAILDIGEGQCDIGAVEF